MASVTLKNVSKIYPRKEKKSHKKNAVIDNEPLRAVDNFNLEIKDGEFVVFVGPSGCGKSTTLRMIAGLEEISEGEIYIGDNLVNDVEPKDRDIAMVFQNYALYPHMTVYENIALGLKLRKIPDIKKDKAGNPVLDKEGKEIPIKRHYTKAEIDEKVMAAANALDIVPLLDRKPKEMSGGQRQRVALGRCMVRNPKAFLLDEPLSNLDAKLRSSMRVEISSLHKKLGTTFIYVTHDQVEAMTMGDRIVVMKKGIIQQVDTPNNLFDYPVNVFVAGFIGTPQMNLFKGKMAKINDEEILFTLLNGDTHISKISDLRSIDPAYLDGNEHNIVLGIRGEHIDIVDDGGISFNVSMIEVLGSSAHIFGYMASDDNNDPNNQVIVKTNYRVNYNQGDKIQIKFQDKNIHLFDAETEHTIFNDR